MKNWNWKTTVAGIIAGAIPLLQGISDSMGQGVPIKWLPIVMGLAIMALGVLAKDIGGAVSSVAVLQGFVPANKPIEQVTQKEVKEQAMKNTLKTSLLCTMLLAVALGASGCASTKANVVAATSTDGVQWPFCVDVIDTNELGVLTLMGMLCADATVTLQNLQAGYTAQHPAATYGAVKQVPAK